VRLDHHDGRRVFASVVVAGVRLLDRRPEFLQRAEKATGSDVHALIGQERQQIVRSRADGADGQYWALADQDQFRRVFAAAQVRAAQVRAAQVRAAQVRAAQVRADAVEAA
jgi:hypothetical protein